MNASNLPFLSLYVRLLTAYVAFAVGIFKIGRAFKIGTLEVCIVRETRVFEIGMALETAAFE